MKYVFVLLSAMWINCIASAAINVSSPDGKIRVVVSLEQSHLKYAVYYSGKAVLLPSSLGLQFDGMDFSKSVHIDNISAVSKVVDNYSMLYAKKASIHYIANKRIITCADAFNHRLQIIFQVSNDGVAFRYRLLNKENVSISVLQENTSYCFTTGTRSWIQPVAVAKSGWEHSNPSYEENYEQNIAVGSSTGLGAGWVYPALFKTNDVWMLITEAAVDDNWCATRLQNVKDAAEYTVAFPDPREVFTNKGLLPVMTDHAYSPWRIITIGTLKTIIESTLGTDVALPSVLKNTAFVKPGKASWSWINSKDDYIVYAEQKKYIDFAADMHWQYCLIDADWDRKIGYDKIKELTDYARSKNAGILLWYNSAGDWNTVGYTPRNKLLTHEDREKEFTLLEKMGIKGVKIDFFGGDGQSMIAYYHDILQAAAQHHLLVNFHGATLPRGLARTFPNLLTTEAVKGFEMVTFGQEAADAEANHATMLPFTRNAFDPMDFTPMNLYKINTSVIRKTTAAFELATSVVFLSGIQHFAESPEGMQHMPEFVKDFLRNLPVQWQDVKYIDGYPGKLIVLARKTNTGWYIAGMNGENMPKTLQLNCSFIRNKNIKMITDNETTILQQQRLVVPSNGLVTVTVKPNGGFVMIAE